MMKVLIAYDGSNCAKDGVSQLVRAGLPSSVEALVVTVAEPFPAPVAPDGQPLDASDLADAASALRLAEEARERLKEILPDWEVDVEGLEGNPGRAILKKAEDWGADLVVIGSHGLSVVERFVFGSVSQQVLGGAHTSVRVARGSAHRKGDAISLVLAWDGSDHSRRALDALIKRSWPEETRVWITTAVGRTGRMDPNSENEKVEQQHEEVIRELKENGIEARSIVEGVDPKYLLLSQSERIDADAIFIGARGLSKFERTFLGSVSSSVAARATCSVEVVK